MDKAPFFSENERTEQQRRDVVKFAVGVSMSQSQPPSAQLAELQQRYIAGKIDLEQLASVLDAEYGPAPGPDPHARFAAGEGPLVAPAPHYEPYLDLEERIVSLA